MEKFSCLLILCTEHQRSRDFIPNWSESEVTENQITLEQSFHPHTISTPSARVSGWNITLPENGLWGGCCQVHNDGLRTKETTKRVPDDQWTKPAGLSLDWPTVIMKLWSCLIWAEEKRWKLVKATCHVAMHWEGDCPYGYSEGKNLTLAWKRACLYLFCVCTG